MDGWCWYQGPLTEVAVFNMSGATCERERPLMVLRCLLTFQFMVQTNSDFTDDKQFFTGQVGSCVGGQNIFLLRPSADCSLTTGN